MDFTSNIIIIQSGVNSLRFKFGYIIDTRAYQALDEFHSELGPMEPSEAWDTSSYDTDAQAND